MTNSNGKTMIDLTIRLETPADHPLVSQINEAAFEQKDEAQLVIALREEGALRLSLVAILEGQLVGHIMFSDLPITHDDQIVDGVALAPMAVLPEYQNKGIGSALVREGIEICQTLGVEAIVVLGHPKFYPRFGFAPKLAALLTSPFKE
ncbi:MAG: N-acetyltransferase, partial [Alphaproteobacteria bacterium]|nr:N-acetyltransferase [Alphaproteobacteria bacterium]